MSVNIKLGDIGRGALSEKFDDAMIDVVKNTCDPNTDATTKRKLVIELIFTPNKNDRTQCKLETKVTTKLGAARPLESTVAMGFDRETGEIAAIEHVPGQAPLFGASTPSMGTAESPTVVDTGSQKVVNFR